MAEAKTATPRLKRGFAIDPMTAEKLRALSFVLGETMSDIIADGVESVAAALNEEMFARYESALAAGRRA